MISSLSVQNFKRFIESAFELRTLTVFTGLNGTGKSTAIQALLLARQAVEFEHRAPVVRLNGPHGLALGEAHEVLHPDAREPEIVVTLTVGEPAARHVFRFGVPEDPALNLTIESSPDPAPAELSRPGGSFTYLCAERLGPRDQLGVSAEHADHIGVGVQGEYTAQVLALNESEQVRTALLHPDTEATHGVTTLRTQVEMWAGDIIRPIRINAQWPPGLTASTIRFQEPGLMSEPIRPANMGFGFSYALPIIVAGLLTGPGDLLIVENPEAHLHPAGQSKLGRLLARVAASGAQVLLETHSDHVINGIRLAVAEDRVLPAEHAIVHYLASGAPGSEAIEFNTRGELTKWPQGFFDQIENDLGGLARARRGRT